MRATHSRRAATVYLLVNGSGVAAATGFAVAARVNAASWMQIRHAFAPQHYGPVGGWDWPIQIALGVLAMLLVLATSAAMWRDAIGWGYAAAGVTLALALVMWLEIVSLSVCSGCDGGYPDPVSTPLNRAGEVFGLVVLVCLCAFIWLQAETSDGFWG